MNRTITFPNLVSGLSGLTSSSDVTSDKFIRTLFASITEALTRGESINVPGIGIFSPTHDPQNPIIWTPNEALAATVNEPFACFEPVELGEGVTEEFLSADDSELPENPEVPEADGVIPPVPAGPVIPPIPVSIETTPPKDTPSEEIEPEKTEEPTATCILEENPPCEEPTYYAEEETTERKRGTVKPVIMLIIGIIIGGIAGYLGGRYYSPALSEPVSIEERVEVSEPVSEVPEEEHADTVAADTVSQVVTAPSENVVEKPVAVTDTVTRNRYLTTMARQYYGDYRFWVYIYEENADHLQNPNRIKPGTPIVIPPASKYGIDANDPESVAKAEKRIAEISRKYPQ